ncbi:MAG: hypothetical protein EXS64_20445 [Candidatus Latescibacteria bacterium]|nr:hypothetical protein [Candidatus Latescibacterota bacterium]
MRFYIENASGKRLDSDLAVINIDPPRRPPTFLIRDTLFVIDGTETRIEKTLLVRDDIDAPAQVRLSVQVPPGQPFDAFLRTDPSGRDTLIVRPRATVDSLGYFVLTARNTADQTASTQILVRVVTGPILALPRYIEVPYNDTTYVPLEGYVRGTAPGRPLAWAVQPGIQVNATLLRMKSSDLVRSGDFTSFPGADSLFGAMDSVTVLRVLGTARFFGEEWIKVSVTDRSTGLSDTAALPVYAGVIGQDRKRPTPDIPLPRDPALLNTMLNMKVRTPTGGIQVKRGDRLSWDPMPSFRDQNPRYRLAYGTDIRFLDRPINIVDVGDSTSFILPAALRLNVPFWARVLVTYNGLFSYWSDPLLFVGDRPPDPPILLSPPDGAELEFKELLLRVRAGVDQDGEPVDLRIQVATDSTMRAPVDSTLFQGLTAPLILEFRPDSTRLIPGRVYYWRAVGASGGLETSSPVRSFKLYNLRPVPGVRLVILAPDTARPVIDLRDSIAWRLEYPDSLSLREPRFRMEVAEGYDPVKQELTGVRLDTSGVTLTAVRRLDRMLQYGRTYWYRISVGFAVVTGPSREYFKTTTGVLTFWSEHRPEAFQLLEPADGDTLAEKQILFRWGRAFDADTGDVVNYDLQISRQPDFLDLILNQTVATTSFIVPADSLRARSPLEPDALLLAGGGHGRPPEDPLFSPLQVLLPLHPRGQPPVPAAGPRGQQDPRRHRLRLRVPMDLRPRYRRGATDHLRPARRHGAGPFGRPHATDPGHDRHPPGHPVRIRAHLLLVREGAAHAGPAEPGDGGVEIPRGAPAAALRPASARRKRRHPPVSADLPVAVVPHAEQPGLLHPGDPHRHHLRKTPVHSGRPHGHLLCDEGPAVRKA